MRKKKDNIPNFPQIGSRRTKVSVISIKNSVLPTGCSKREPAYLEIKAMPEDWQKLEDFWTEDFDGFCQEILRNFIEPAISKIEKDTTRGKHKPYRKLVDTMKAEASWLYAFLKYWLKKDREAYPDYLRQFINIAENEFGDIQKSSVHRLKTLPDGSKTKKPAIEYDILLLTHFALEKIRGKEANEQNLEPFNDYDSFYLTYCFRANRIYNSFIFNKSVKDDPEYIKNLVYKIPALNSVFKTLKLI
jgi:hypothetical protein